MTKPEFLGRDDGRRCSTGGAFPARALVEAGAADFSIWEETLAPDPRGVPLHRHGSYDEGFWIIEGEVRITADEATRVCRTGEFAFVPRGVAHRFANASETTARMLVIASSRALAMVEEVAQLVNKTPPDLAKIVAAFQRHDSELVVPEPR